VARPLGHAPIVIVALHNENKRPTVYSFPSALTVVSYRVEMLSMSTRFIFKGIGVLLDASKAYRRSSKVMRLGIYGGSFDPVHYGHLLLAESCREQLALDKVFFVPAGLPPHKREVHLTSAVHRLAMLELAIGGEPDFEICRYEVDRQEISYTVETLRWFRSQFPEAELYLLVGADMLNDLPNWREASEICRLAQPVGVKRGGSAPPSLERLASILPVERLDWLQRTQVDMPQIALSASDIRRRVSQGQSIRFRVPKAVEQYILQHQLYRNNNPEGTPAASHQGC